MAEIYEEGFEEFLDEGIDAESKKHYRAAASNYYKAITEICSYLIKNKTGKLAIRRNPLIADLLHRIKFVEKMGTGINRIKRECRKHGKVNFDVETNGYFVSVFRLKKDLEKDLGNLTKNRIKIIEVLKKNPKLTQKELASVIGINEKNIRNNISILKKMGFLERIGPDKGGYWKIKR